MRLLPLLWFLVSTSAFASSWFPAPTQTVDFSAEELTRLQTEFHTAYDSDFMPMGGKFELTFFKSIFSYLSLATMKGDVHQVAIMAGNLSKKSMDMDSVRLLICHEVGHFMGGGPRRIELDPAEDQEWNVIEGAADYFATTQCMKRILKGQDHFAALLGRELDADMIASCEESFSGSDEIAVCERTLLASQKLIAFFAMAKKVENTFRFDTPDSTVVPVTSSTHPELQCRLDTYRAGALCDVDPWSVMNPKDLSQGTCSDRPACWFHTAN